MNVPLIVFNVFCIVGSVLFAIILWRLVQEARGDYEPDEHEDGGIG